MHFFVDSQKDWKKGCKRKNAVSQRNFLLPLLFFIIIKNVSSSTALIKLSLYVFPKLREYDENLRIWICRFFILWSLTSEVMKGHKRSLLSLKLHFLSDILFIQNLTLSKLNMNDNIINTRFFVIKLWMTQVSLKVT